MLSGLFRVPVESKSVLDTLAADSQVKVRDRLWVLQLLLYNTIPSYE